MAVAIKAEGLSKQYIVGRPPAHDTLRDAIMTRVRGTRAEAEEARRMWALKDVSLEIQQGEIVGIIGRNGAGKSTLLKILSRITAPTKGRAEIHGRVGSLLEVGTGFHPELSGRENIFLNGAILGMTKVEIRRRFDDIVEFAEIGRYLDTPIKRYSSGMYVRLAFSVAAHFEPDVLLIDEVLSVGDQEFQRRCLGRVQEISQGGRTVLFVSHNLAAVASLCSRAYLLQRGEVRSEGPVDRVLADYASSMRDLAARSLVDRDDRRGNGDIRFTAVAVEGPDGGPAQVGEPARFVVDIDVIRPRTGVEVSIAVFGPLGEALFHCQSRANGRAFELTGGPARVVCTIPELPLLPGNYTLNLFSSVGGDVFAVQTDILDWVQDATRFEVLESDYLGSGHLPTTSHGHVVVRQEWTAERVADGVGSPI